MTERKPITDKMKWMALLFWNGIRCPECNDVIEDYHEIEWDHRHALVHGGEHHHTNIMPMHATCHTQKTKRDVKANAKVKRLERQRNGLPKRARDKHKKKIKSRGFPKVHRPMTHPFPRNEERDGR